MHYHLKHQKWLPPGGHLEPSETPQKAALRETKEETGLEIAFLLQENLWIEEKSSRSLVRPYICLLEEIPANGDQPAHQHIDFIFLAKPLSGTLSPAFCWFSLEELASLDLFPDTYPIVAAALQKETSPAFERSLNRKNCHVSPNVDKF